jgi:LETM1-like protein
MKNSNNGQQATNSQPKPLTAITVDLSSRLNPPSSTLPPPLSVPSRQPNQSLFSYAYRAGHAYLTFYKSGIKAIFANRRAASGIRHRLNATQTPQLPPSPLTSSPSSSSKKAKEAENLYTKYILTRAEFQLLFRNQHDISRVPIFALLFLILGEWLPLIVIFFTPLIPYTCRIPRQVEGDRAKFETRRLRSFRGEIDGKVPGPYVKETDSRIPARLEELDRTQLMHISRSLGLHFRIWDTLAKGVLPPTFLLKSKVRRRLAYLEQDDVLLLRDSSESSTATDEKVGKEELSPEEVKMACEERGIDVVGRAENELRTRLAEWLGGRQKGKILGMLLSRPNVWSDL